MFTLLATFFSPLGSFFSKIAVYLIGAGVVIGLITVAYIQWKDRIQTQALIQYNNTQLQQAIADQQKFAAEQNAINAVQQAAVDDFTKAQQDIQTQLGTVNTFLNSQTTIKEDKSASDVIKQTIDKLR